MLVTAYYGGSRIVDSTSGGSRNIMALEDARKQNMMTVTLPGYDGRENLRRSLVDLPIVARCDYIPRIQEVQASIYHIIREALEDVTAATLERFGTVRCPHTQEMRRRSCGSEPRHPKQTRPLGPT